MTLNWSEEVVAKTRAANAVEGAIGKFWGNTKYPEKVRLNVAKSLVHSKLLVSSGLAPVLTELAQKKMEVAYAKPIRRITGDGWTSDTPDITGRKQVIAKASLPQLEDVQCAARLRLVARIASGPVVLRALAQQEWAVSWRKQVADDVRRVKTVVGERLEKHQVQDGTL